ncbi:MAG TPA: replicative DNA helicase [Patescibacteria group bacterium]
MPDEIIKIPPQNIEAEQSFLGSLLIDKDAVIKVADSVRPEDFYKNVHQMIYEAMLDLYVKHEPIDLLSLSNRLEEKDQLEKIGGRSYLTSLANLVPTASNVDHYGGIVQKKATLRRLLRAASEITKLGYDEVEDVDIVLDQSEKSLFAVSQKYLRNIFVPVKSVLADAFDRIDELHREKGKLRGIPTGYQALDNLLGGLQKSDLVIIAARPSIGKTSLALDFARTIATKNKIPVGIFSLEMSKEQLVDRLICAEANVDLWRMRTGKLSDREDGGDFPRIGHAMGTLSEAPIYIDDSPTATVMNIKTKARRLQAENGLGLILIDYLQLMEGRGNTDNRVLEISEITRSLKGIARELNIPVIALSQLNRSVESRTPPIPKLADLRESGSIEQDADVVMFIYREDYYKRGPEKNHIADIFIAKHRNGPTGNIQLYFDENIVSFKNLEKKIKEEDIPGF